MTANNPRLQALRAAINNINLDRFRFWVQLLSFLLLVYGGHLAINLGSRLPFFSCGYNQEGKAGVCFLLPLQHQLSRPWPVLLSAASLTVLFGFLIFSLWFLALNKGWCGFICPLGTLQDWISALRIRLGIRYSNYTQSQFSFLSKIKYLLIALSILIPLGIGGGYFTRDLGTPICLLCPGRVIEPLFAGDWSQFSIDFSSKTNVVLTTLGVVIAGLFLIGAFVRKRFYCLFCPMSALHYLISKPALLKLEKHGAKCTRCGDCYRVCDMKIKAIADDVKTKNIMMDDCMLCMKCVAACPEPGALKARFCGVTVFESTESGFIKRTTQGIRRDQS